MDLCECTLCITSANNGAQDSTFIFFDKIFLGMESVTINSFNFDCAIRSWALFDKRA